MVIKFTMLLLLLLLAWHGIEGVIPSHSRPASNEHDTIDNVDCTH